MTKQLKKAIKYIFDRGLVDTDIDGMGESKLKTEYDVQKFIPTLSKPYDYMPMEAPEAKAFDAGYDMGYLTGLLESKK